MHACPHLVVDGVAHIRADVNGIAHHLVFDMVYHVARGDSSGSGHVLFRVCDGLVAHGLKRRLARALKLREILRGVVGEGYGHS